MNVENGGVVSAPFAIVGRRLAGHGTATITDEDSELNVDKLYLGANNLAPMPPGDGTLNILNGGDVYVGDDQPANLTGSRLVVSKFGTPAELMAGNNSEIVNDGETFIGYSLGALGDVTIDHSDWTNSRSIRVGYIGEGTFNIENSSDVAVLNNNAVEVASGEDSTGVLNVDGSGTELTAFAVFAGTRGNGTLNVTNGAVVDNLIGFIAEFDGEGTATINGLGSRWKNLNLYLGGTTPNMGGVGTLNIENQAVVNVGDDLPPMNDALIVSDSSTRGNLSVLNGSQINSGSSYVGYSPGFSGEVTVSGVDSQFNVSNGDLNVGFLGDGSLLVSDDGAVTVLGGHTVVGANSSVLMDQAQIDVGNVLTLTGLLEFDGGTSHVMGNVTNESGGQILVNSLSTAMFHDIVQNETEIRTESGGEICFMDLLYGSGVFTGPGIVCVSNVLSPGNDSPGFLYFDGDVVLNSTAQLRIEMHGPGSSNRDRIGIAGELSLDGNISVNLLNGFEPTPGLEYLIAVVDGNVTGQFIGYGQDDLLGQVNNLGIYISYSAGDGNDVALYAAVIPDIVVPNTISVTRGLSISGGVADIAHSDNSDVTVRRNNADIQSRTELEIEAVSPTANPSSMEVILEGSVFARSTVVQNIELYNFVTGDFELVDSRNATQFVDSVANVAITGDLSRFVEPITMLLRARVRYQSPRARQRFSSSTDLFNWAIAE